jgi:hypothetical protein
MVVERRNELSVMEERVALPCVLAIWCTAWMNFVYSLLRGDSEIECLLEELDNGTFDDEEHVFSGEYIGGYLPHCYYTNSQQVHQGLLACGETHNRSI